MTKDTLSKEDRQLLRARYHNKIYDFGANLLKNGVRDELFEQIMADGDKVNFDSARSRQQWLDGATRRMEALMPADRVKDVREKSACCLGGVRDEIARAIRVKYATVEERFEAFSHERTIIGGNAWTKDGKYYVCFWYAKPEKGYPCSCLHYVPKKEPMTPTWCMCCGGHIKHFFELALGVIADCNLVSSSLTSKGEQPCLFELTITGEAHE